MTDKDDIFGEPFTDYPYVRLSAEEVEEVKRLAKEIYYSNIYSSAGDFDKSFMSNHIGSLGEFAFAKYYGLDFNDEVLHGGDSYDFKVYHVPSDESGTIDVKTISFNGGDMLIQTSRELKTDVYALVEKRGSAFGLIGYQTASEVAQATSHPPGVYSPVEVRRIPREALQPLPDPDDIQGINRDAGE